MTPRTGRLLWIATGAAAVAISSIAARPSQPSVDRYVVLIETQIGQVVAGRPADTALASPADRMRAGLLFWRCRINGFDYYLGSDTGPPEQAVIALDRLTTEQLECLTTSVVTGVRLGFSTYPDPPRLIF